MPEILEMIKDKDRLSFSQNYSVKRPYKGNTLFPDVKTPNLEAEYYRLSQGSALPTLAWCMRWILRRQSVRDRP